MNSRFFLSRKALSLFFTLFFLPLSRSFFGFALASAKARKKRLRPFLLRMACTVAVPGQGFHTIPADQ